eukprot:2980941-Prymnesium_polylepis.1
MLRRIERLWRHAGMRLMVKAFVGLYQCTAAIPSVYDVSVPEGLEHYAKWIQLFEFPADIGINVLIPASCFGSYRNRLLVGLLWPLVLSIAVIAGLVGWELTRKTTERSGANIGRGTVSAGLQRALPPILLLTFILVPSAATRTFK